MQLLTILTMAPLLGAFIGHQAAAPEAVPTGTVEGYVTYRGGPLHGQFSIEASVFLYDASGRIASNTTTDGTGHYSLGPVALDQEVEVVAFPPPSVLGENNVRTGYLMSESSSFVIPLDGNVTLCNLSLNHYERHDLPPAHPSVKVLDRNGDPVNGATVKAITPNGTYSDRTDPEGWAVFVRLNGTSFPEGTVLRAVKEGYVTIEWSSGAPAPRMGTVRLEDDTLLVSLLIFLAMVSLVIALVLIGVPGGTR